MATSNTVHGLSPARSFGVRLIHRCRSLTWLLVASTGLGPFGTLASAAPARFQSKDANPKATQEDRETVEEPRFKLQYFNASWETVLKDIAEKSGSTLVADRVPKGSFSRRDRNSYTREEALRIINQDLEKLGFRVLEKGEFMVVLDLPSQRPRYQRPTVPRPDASNVNGPPQVESTRPPARQVQRVTPAPEEADDEGSSRRVQPANFTQEDNAATATRRAAEDLLLDKTTRPGTTGEVTVVVFRARNQRAATLAKHVFRGFRDRAELLDAGRNGLPAFRVRGSEDAADRTAVQFAVAIDEDKEELLIDARPSEAEAMLKLLRLLDTPTLEVEPVQLVSTTRTVCAVASQFEGQSQKIQQAKVEGRGGPDLFAQADAPAQPQAQDGEMPARPQTPLGDVVGNLKGEVNIESVPDLGVLILKGNQADVEQVMQVIRELEKLSEQTAPQMELLFLQNVNSEALAELLTTVYESLAKFPGKATQPRQSVAILPVTKPNAILIVAPAVDLEGIKSLADELDKPVDPESEFQVFHLQMAVATQVEGLLTEFFAERKGLGPRVVIRSDTRTNSIIASGRPNDLDEVATLIRKIDQAESVSASQVKIFPLQNAVATELAAVLNLAIQSVLSPPSSTGASSVFGQGAGVGGAQVAEDFRDVRSSVLQFLAIDAAGEKKLRSGILADIRITPDPRMNSLIVSAPESSLTLVGELIKQLDRPTNQVAEIKVFTLANADAQLMVQQLQALFNVSTTQGGQTRQQTGVQVAGAEDASSGLIPLRFSVDTRTNSVIAIGGADALRVVEAIMLRLDESDVRQRQNTIYRLKNSPSDAIAQAITSFFTSQSDLAANDPNLFSTVEQLEREVIVVSEPVSNSLLISATPRYNTEILRLVERLDAAPQQVVIQALIVEVELNDTDEFGIELGFQDSILFDRSIIDNILTTTTTTTVPNGNTTTQTNVISQSSSPGYLFGNPTTPLGNNTSPNINPSQVGSQGLSNFSLGRTNGDLGFGGLVLSASSESVSFLLRALSENRQVRVLSRPQIRTMDNQQAQIVQGQEVPVVNGVQFNGIGGVANPTITREEAGVILNVTPRISPDGNVVMALTAEKSQFNLNNGVVIFTDATTGNTVTAPVKDLSTAITTISVPSGQTVVLGGLITSRTDEVHRKVPWLGDIPILGYAFRYDFLQTRRTELLIFLTPRIVWDDAESEHIKDVEMARVHFIESEAEEMHGPLRGVPAEEMYPGGSLDPRYPAMLQPVAPPAGMIPATPVPVNVVPPVAPVPAPVVPPAPEPTLNPSPAPAEKPAIPNPGLNSAAGTPEMIRPATETNSPAKAAAPPLPLKSEVNEPKPLPLEKPAVIPPPPPEDPAAARQGKKPAAAVATRRAVIRDSAFTPASATASPTGKAIQQMTAEFEDPAPTRQSPPTPATTSTGSAAGAVKLGRKPWTNSSKP